MTRLHSKNGSSATREEPSSTTSPAAKLSLEAHLQQLGFSRDGLTSEEAERRLQKYGPNELPEKGRNPIRKFFSYFWGPIPIMIEIAAVLSAVLRHWPDFGVILALLFMNAIVGFREEYQAGNAVAALKQRLALQSSVRRDRHWQVVPSRELVPGDLVRLHAGVVVPADTRLLEAGPLQIDQSALTGESLPVDRGVGEVAYSGSLVKKGEADAVVYATGGSAFFGKTATLVEEAGQSRSHFERAVIKIADYLILVALFLALIILVVSLFRHEKFLEVLQFTLVLTIAAVPVAMPAVLSVTMALGARTLTAKQAIVTRLSAVEEMAGVDVLCSDKTGTLTQNRLEAGQPFLLDQATPAEQVMLVAALASREEDQDPIDLAVLGSLPDSAALGDFTVSDFVPFDAVRKMTEAQVAGPDGTSFKVAKGAPQVILALDPAHEGIRARVDEAIEGFAARGFRSLGVARSDDGGAYRFLGILPLYDPVREDSRDTIQAAREMGLDVKMITGDQVAIAREIAGQLGLSDNILGPEALESAQSGDDSSLAATITHAGGFAQVFPEHKYRIVRVLQRTGHIVGMTGDGVNDAPALKQADAGIAVDGATDVARAAADIVLLLPGLSVIVDAIRESRKTFQRMSNYAIYRIAETIALLIFLTLTIVIAGFYPVTAIMIVLLAILNDGAILAIAYDRVQFSNRPEQWDMRLILGPAAILGMFAVIRSFGIFYIGDHLLDLQQDAVQTLVYLNLSIGGHLTLFAARTRGPFWSSKPAFPLLGAVIGTQIVATFIAVYGLLMTPLGWKWAGLVWGYCLVMLVIQDFVKLLGAAVLEEGPTSFFGRLAMPTHMARG
jgi:H+-transporting ATPase